MSISIIKVTNTLLKYYEVHMFFHIYIVKSFFFGAGIILLTNTQETTLKKIYESSLLQKLGLGAKFPRSILYVTKQEMGLGFISPKTISDQIKLKMFIGNIRAQTKTSVGIKVLHELL